MKISHLLFFVLLSFSSFSQTINYCEYFSFEVTEREYEGEKFKSASPIALPKKDEFGKFINEHRLRFDYILFKNPKQFKDIASYYPDSLKIHNEFCKILNTNEVQKYFTSLSPKTLSKWDVLKDTFSIKELMMVASKFFYCDEINRKDTTIQSRICVAMNGISDLQTNRDLTLLEAFSIEAIFSYLSKENKPLFSLEFYSFKRKIAKEKLNEFVDFESYLLEIRNQCYRKMQNNEDLQEKLIAYYEKNKDNLNFIIN